MSEIEVQRLAASDAGWTFGVRVAEGGTETRHEVTVGSLDYERLGSGHGSPQAFVRACFEFLLEREPKESILSRFDITVIGRYFPEFEGRIARG